MIIVSNLKRNKRLVLIMYDLSTYRNIAKKTLDNDSFI